MGTSIKDVYAEERAERDKRKKALLFLQRAIEKLEAIELEALDDPLLFENYKCEVLRTYDGNPAHCVLIPTDAIPLLDVFVQDADEADDLYVLERFQSTPLIEQDKPALFTIVQHVTNCIFKYVSKNTEVRWAVGPYDAKSAETHIRHFFAAVAESNSYMVLSETSIYMRNIEAFYAKLCFYFGILLE